MALVRKKVAETFERVWVRVNASVLQTVVNSLQQSFSQMASGQYFCVAKSVHVKGASSFQSNGGVLAALKMTGA